MAERSGIFAVLGRPNVGKSTLINALVGEKVSITANRPQTTRHSITGIRMFDQRQMVFVDTPGIHSSERKALNRQLNRAARGTLADVDLVLVVFRVMRWTEEDQRVLSDVQASGLPYILVPNMMDRVNDKHEAAEYLSQLNGLDQAQAVVPISARKANNLDALVKQLDQHCQRPGYLFDPEMYTDKSMRFIAAELVREQATRLLESELPYALTVEIESFEVEQDRYVVHACIWVERDSQKGIVIGKGGARLKQIGSLARQAMIRQFDARVHLQIWVKVRKDWSDNEAALHALGYQDSDTI